MAEGRAVPYPVVEFRRAVEAEIAAVLHDDMGGAEKVSLHDGRPSRGGGNEREYLFSCKKWKDAFAFKDLLIRPSRSRGPWQPAVVSRMPDGRIRVSTAADLGARPLSAQLVEDESAGLQALAE